MKTRLKTAKDRSAAPSPVRVLVADDSAFARAHLRQLISSRGLDVVGEAANAAEVLDRYSVLRPDVVTMDLIMPGLTGLDAILALRDLDPDCKIVLITAVREDPIIKGLPAMGISVVHKPVRWRELETALRGSLSANSGAS